MTIRITIDVETSGFDSKTCGIIEVGAVCFENGVEVAQFSELVNPGEGLLSGAKVDDALTYSGITRAQIAAARSTDAVRADLFAWLGVMRPTEGLHAFNVQFEARFLEKGPWLFREGTWGECIMLAAGDVMAAADKLPLFKNGKPKWPKLAEAAEYFGVMQKGEHRALNDARTAALVYEEILKRRK